jgi:hypothetical protein
MSDRPFGKSRGDRYVGRRHVLRGAAVAATFCAGSVLLPRGVWSAKNFSKKIDADPREAMHGEALTSAQREVLLDEAITSVRRAMNAPDVLEAFAGQGVGVVTRVLRPLQTHIDASYVKETKYDASEERKRYCVQVAFQRGLDGKKAITFRSSAAGSQPLAKAGYGNGFFWGRADRLVTAQHVLDEALSRPAVESLLDVAVVNVPPHLIADSAQIIRDDTSLTNAEIHGAFVSVEGIDPDATSIDGCKSYPGVAMRLRRRFVERAFSTLKPFERERLSSSFVFALPPGEAVGATDESKPAAGMSGSPVFLYRNGSRVLAGILHSVLHARDPPTGDMTDIGFFHGVEEIRQQLSL